MGLRALLGSWPKRCLWEHTTLHWVATDEKAGKCGRRGSQEASPQRRGKVEQRGKGGLWIFVPEERNVLILRERKKERKIVGSKLSDKVNWRDETGRWKGDTELWTEQGVQDEGGASGWVAFRVKLHVSGFVHSEAHIFYSLSKTGVLSYTGTMLTTVKVVVN